METYISKSHLKHNEPSLLFEVWLLRFPVSILPPQRIFFEICQSSCGRDYRLRPQKTRDNNPCNLEKAPWAHQGKVTRWWWCYNNNILSSSFIVEDITRVKEYFSKKSNTSSNQFFTSFIWHKHLSVPFFWKLAISVTNIKIPFLLFLADIKKMYFASFSIFSSPHLSRITS